MQFASPLGVGITGERELLDITLSPPVPLPELRSGLEAKLAPGVRLVSLAELDKKPSAVQNLLIGADYTILIYAAPGEIEPATIEERIQNFLAQETIWRERERKGEAYTYNLRPLVFELRYEGYDTANEEHRIFLRVQQRAGATGRPDEVVDSLGMDDYARTLRRDRIYLRRCRRRRRRLCRLPCHHPAADCRQKRHRSLAAPGIQGCHAQKPDHYAGRRRHALDQRARQRRICLERRAFTYTLCLRKIDENARLR